MGMNERFVEELANQRKTNHVRWDGDHAHDTDL